MALVHKIFKRLFYYICFFIPIKRKQVFFSSFYGKGYGDNLKYICEVLLKNDDFTIYWLVKNDKEASTLPKKVSPIYANSYKSIFIISTSSIWINNCRFNFYHKKHNQLYIQTWHGGGGQKKCELDAIGKLGKPYEKFASSDSKQIDIMISDSAFMTKLFHSSFWYNGPVYECGYPRYDILFQKNSSIVKKIREIFHLKSNVGILLYAPTFRDHDSLKSYNVDYKRLLMNLEIRFKKEYVILVRLHPNLNINKASSLLSDFVIDCSSYPDAQELLVASDILLGDYSSINYDFSLQRKPVFRFASDLLSYKNERDTYFDFEEYPYPFATNNDELENIVLNFDFDTYLSRLNAFFLKIGAVANPHSSLECAKLVKDFLDDNNKTRFLERNKKKFVWPQEEKV